MSVIEGRAIVAAMNSAVHPRHVNAGYAPRVVDALLELGLSLPGPMPVLGLAGVQGTGKTTLSRQIAGAARSRGLDAVAISIDDVYLTHAERRVLARQTHPLLATRGPPGSHDVGLACAALDALAAAGPSTITALPGFDKIADERLPPSQWRSHRGRPDLVVFEGWFLCTPPEDAQALREPINRLEREEDRDGRWRTWCNTALAGYAPLWQRLDHLVFLQPPGFEVVREWRWQQECSLQADNPGRRTMDHAAVMRFIEFFERTSRRALHSLPGLAGTRIRIDARRQLLDPSELPGNPSSSAG